MRHKNSTGKRLEYSARQDVPVPVLSVLARTAAMTAGMDRLAAEIRSDLIWRELHGRDFPSPAGYVDEIAHFRDGPKLIKGRTPIDKMLPWLGVQLSREYRSGRWSESNLRDLVPRKGPALAQWFEQGVNLGEWTIYEVLDEIEGMDEGDNLDAEGEVVGEFNDGWQVVRLTDPDAMEAEGRIMQNCLRHGHYQDEVSNETGYLLSIRDDRGRSHVDMYYDVGDGAFTEVFGKQNDDPVPKYWPYIGGVFDESGVLAIDYDQQLHIEALEADILSSMRKLDTDVFQARLLADEVITHLQEYQRHRDLYLSGAGYEEAIDSMSFEIEEALHAAKSSSNVERTYGDSPAYSPLQSWIEELRDEFVEWMEEQEGKDEYEEPDEDERRASPPPFADIELFTSMVKDARDEWSGLSWDWIIFDRKEPEKDGVYVPQFNVDEDPDLEELALEAARKHVIGEKNKYVIAYEDSSVRVTRWDLNLQ